MSDMEAMIFHFKQVMEGVMAPPGEAAHGNREPEGRLGYFRLRRYCQTVRWRIRPRLINGLPPQAVRRRAAVRRYRDQCRVDIVKGEIDR
jgi:NADH-quinone oxidoreductase subunit D